MTVDAQAVAPSEDAAVDPEGFRLDAEELRFVADWVRPDDRIRVELPTEVAGLLRLRRSDRDRR